MSSRGSRASSSPRLAEPVAPRNDGSPVPPQAPAVYSEGRPAANGTATSHASNLRPTLPGTVDTTSELDALAVELNGYLVLQVEVDDVGHRRTTIVRSASAAERAVRRARDRGRAARVTVCQLLPVHVTSLGGAP